MADLSTLEPTAHSGVKFPPPLIYGGSFVAGFLLEQVFSIPGLSSPVSSIAGLIFTVAGIILCIWSIGLFRQARTSLVPVKPSTALVSSGPYCFTRNPMYLGLAFLYTGLALWLQIGWALILLPLVMAVVQYRVIAKEEQYLEQRFGTEYLTYRGRVRRWL